MVQNNEDYLEQVIGFAQQLIGFLTDFVASPDTRPAAAKATKVSAPPCSARLAIASIQALDAIDLMAAHVLIDYGSQVDAVSAVVKVFASAALANSPPTAAAGVTSAAGPSGMGPTNGGVEPSQQTAAVPPTTAAPGVPLPAAPSGMGPTNGVAEPSQQAAASQETAAEAPATADVAAAEFITRFSARTEVCT